MTGIVDFNENSYLYRINFKTALWDDNKIQEVASKIFPNLADLGIESLRVREQEELSYDSDALQLDDSNEERTEAAKIIRIHCKGLVIAGGYQLPYDEWLILRDKSLGLILDLTTENIIMIDRFDSLCSASFPSEKLSDDLFSNLFPHNTQWSNSCPMGNPQIRNFHLLLKGDELCNAAIAVDTEEQYRGEPRVEFAFGFPIFKPPIDKEIKDIAAMHTKIIDGWLPQLHEDFLRKALKKD
jgi:hypothetical protein